MAELQAQQGGGGGGGRGSPSGGMASGAPGAGGADDAQKQAHAEDQRRTIMSQILSPEARERRESYFLAPPLSSALVSPPRFWWLPTNSLRFAPSPPFSPRHTERSRADLGVRSLTLLSLLHSEQDSSRSPRTSTRSRGPARPHGSGRPAARSRFRGSADRSARSGAPSFL